jgi:hypothetical protein
MSIKLIEPTGPDAPHMWAAMEAANAAALRRRERVTLAAAAIGALIQGHTIDAARIPRSFAADACTLADCVMRELDRTS